MTVEYSGMQIAVLGFGRAGRAAADFLLDRGARLTVYAERSPREEDLRTYAARGVAFCIGPFPPCFPHALLVRSPGIRPDLPCIRASVAAGAMLSSETELFMTHTPATVIGVTGSDGKTTTTALIAALLRAAGYRVYAGGNNGVPLLPLVDEMRAGDWVVLELSSFQLMTLARAPEIAVVTNITPNHLDWHTELAEYVAAKRCICGDRTKLLVENATAPRFSNVHCSRVTFAVREGELILRDDKGEQRIAVPTSFCLPGRHNLENLAAALAATRTLVSLQTAHHALAGFRGVAHRLQYVDTVAGVAYYNSSIDTSPTRTAAALEAIGGHPLVIAGGRGKGISLQPLGDALAVHARAVFLYGEMASTIQSAIGGRVAAACFPDFDAAFCAAADAARDGDVVLLSPGCTAFDCFRDFEERGTHFCRLVQERKRNEDLYRD